MVKTTDVEKESLEVHVEMCSQRYEILEKRLGNIEVKVEAIHSVMTENRSSIVRVIVGAAGTVIAGLLSTIVVLLMKVH